MEATKHREALTEVLERLGIGKKNPSIVTGAERWHSTSSEYFPVLSPADGQELGQVQFADESQYEMVMETAQAAYLVWRDIPAPKRGEIVRQIGEALRTHKDDLGMLVSMEMGKILQEGLGEVQEMIDICDFAVGLSRQLYGLSMHSERLHHRMYEQWHPLGIVGIISAFNFPVAVWAWNAMIAAVCGNVSVWKPSEKTPLTAFACLNIISGVLKENELPEGVFNLVQGDRVIGAKMADDPRIPLVSATGSTRMGKSVAEAVAKRLGKSILELGGNNAVIVSQHANLQMAIPAIIFGAVGTCGQRCTSTRRVLVHSEIYDKFKKKLLEIYQDLPKRIGHPVDAHTLIGPLIDTHSVEMMQAALEKLKAEGAEILIGGEVVAGEGFESGTYVSPALVEASHDSELVRTETFAPILYLIKYDSVEEAISINNEVPQGLSSAIFTENLRESERFLSLLGSDCGIANVNIGTSGAEIGGAFGGEKETGGGRESGSDAWKAYMRRQTNTINWSEDLPLAQGIRFNI